MEIPNLNDVCDPADIKQKGGSFNASYINWARTLSAIRERAPGWMPEMVESKTGYLHDCPDGSCFVMIRFVHEDGTETAPVPHAIMNNRMKSISRELISSRDLSDAFVRGACKAGAVAFGYAWKLWSGDDPMERDEESAPVKDKEITLTATAEKEEPTMSLDDLKKKLGADES